MPEIEDLSNAILNSLDRYSGFLLTHSVYGQMESAEFMHNSFSELKVTWGKLKEANYNQSGALPLFAETQAWSTEQAQETVVQMWLLFLLPVVYLSKSSPDLPGNSLDTVLNNLAELLRDSYSSLLDPNVERMFKKSELTHEQVLHGFIDRTIESIQELHHGTPSFRKVTNLAADLTMVGNLLGITDLNQLKDLMFQQLLNVLANLDGRMLLLETPAQAAELNGLMQALQSELDGTAVFSRILQEPPVQAEAAVSRDISSTSIFKGAIQS